MEDFVEQVVLVTACPYWRQLAHLDIRIREKSSPQQHYLRHLHMITSTTEQQYEVIHMVLFQTQTEGTMDIH